MCLVCGHARCWVVATGMRRAPHVPRFAPAAVALATALACHPARADDGLRLSVDWGKLGDVLCDGAARLLHHGSGRVERSVAPGGTGRLVPRSRAEAMPPSQPPPDAKWLGASPQVSLVARDWGASQLLVGQLTLTDQLRVIRSIRMVVSRVRLANGRLSPFAQLGLGQWRVDNDLLPLLPRDVELAGQAGGGCEFALARAAALAVEVDYTVLYREQHQPQMVTGPRIVGAYLAARAVF